MVNQTVEPRRALVTGATGYVGSNLARRLVRDDWEVHIVSRPGARIPTFSEFSQITNHVHDGSTEGMIHCVTLSKPNVVFHLASMIQAQHEFEDVEPMIRGNVLFGSQLLEGMRVNGVTNLINTGTYWQHYNNEDYNPVCLYAATKQAFESILEYYIQVCNVSVITLELFDTYGPDDHRAKLFSVLNAAINKGGSLDMSPGGQHLAPVFVDDVINAYLLASNQLLQGKGIQHEHYSVSPAQSIRLCDFVQMYLDVSGKAIDINWGKKPYRVREVMEPWNRGVWIENWRPRVKLEDGLRQAIHGGST